MEGDIGIDLGTTKIVAYDDVRGELFNEPNVVAINNDTGEVLAIGNKAHAMLGRTPDYITAVNPLEDGIISDYNLTNIMIRHVLKTISGDMFIKPRVAVCIPSVITDVEKRAVVDAALSGGARKVFLIDEPVAAAIGAGIDISKPVGRMIVDIGGGTTDVALLSLSGVVEKHSVKTAGNALDRAIIKFVKETYGILIGQRMAEAVKINIGTVTEFEGENFYEIKGRDLFSGLPVRKLVSWRDIRDSIAEPVEEITKGVQKVFEESPAELAGDLKEYGILLTGGGSLLHGLPDYFAQRFTVGCTVPESPITCVARGTAHSFSLTGYLRDFMSESNERLH